MLCTKCTCPFSSENEFGVRYSGFLSIPKTGVYTFHAPPEFWYSDIECGYDLRLFIDGQEWQSSTRRHAFGQWPRALEKGLHAFRCIFIDVRRQDGKVESWSDFPHPKVLWQGKAPELEASEPGLPAGRYTFYFGADTTMNGAVDSVVTQYVQLRQNERYVLSARHPGRVNAGGKKMDLIRKRTRRTSLVLALTVSLSSCADYFPTDDIPTLVKRLGHPDAGVYGAAMGKLTDAGEPAVRPLIRALADTRLDGHHRLRVARVLADIKNPKAVAPLIRALNDQNSLVRSNAALALGKLGDKAAIEPLRGNLTDWECSRFTWQALQELGWTPETPSEEVYVKVAERDGVWLTQHQTLAMPILRRDLESTDDRIRKNALYACMALGRSEYLPLLIDLLDQHGTKGLAETYLNSGSAELARAAENWAKSQGYVIHAGRGERGARWGFMR